MRLIDIEPLEKEGWHLQRYVAGMYGAAIEFKDISEIPIVDAVPVVHGRWIARDNWIPVSMTAATNCPKCICSVCGRENESNFGHEYCPHCGAKMDEQQ